MNGDNLSGTTPNKGLENDADIATNPPQSTAFSVLFLLNPNVNDINE